MSADQSNLAKYGYDMVVATTQSSVNATMKQWLLNCKEPVFIQAYKYDFKDGHDIQKPDVIPADYEQLKRDIGFDPFGVGDEVQYPDMRIQKMQVAHLAFIVKMELGLPDVSPSDIPSVVEFKNEGKAFKAKILFRNFQVVALSWPPNKWMNFSQDDDNVMSIECAGELNKRTEGIDKFMNELPQDTRNTINSKGKEKFSVQQLFSYMRTTDNPFPKVQRFSDFRHLEGILMQCANTFVSRLNNNGGLKLGFSVVGNVGAGDKASLIPTAVDGIISAYKDNAGKATTDYKAYTLNYLVMAQNKSMPVASAMAWNWVEKDKTSQYAGVMSVRRNTFIDFLQSLLSPSLKEITLQPATSFSTTCTSVRFFNGYSHDQSAKSYSVMTNPGAHALRFDWYRENESSDSSYCGIWGVWGNIKSKYYTVSDVYLEGNIIRVVTRLTAFLHLMTCGGVVEGNFAIKEATTKYEISVDAFGLIKVKGGETDVKDYSAPVDPDWWLKFISMGEVTGVVEGMKNQLGDRLFGYTKNHARAIENALNGSGAWVFPGGKSFAFKDVRFSANQDLVANILYLDPIQLQTLRTKGMTALLGMLKEEAVV